MLGYTTLCNHKIIFQIAASFLTFIFHKVVQRLIYGVVGYFYMSLLQIYHRDCQRNNCQNRLLFGEVVGKSLVSCFFIDSLCISWNSETMAWSYCINGKAYFSENPEWWQICGHVRQNAEYSDAEIWQRQVDEEEIGDGSHAMMRSDDEYHQWIPCSHIHSAMWCSAPACFRSFSVQ